MSETILINQMFAGSYLGEAQNVGHEIINLFQADDGQNYLYITKTGRVSSPKSIRSVVFVQNFKSGTTVEVVAVAPVVEPVEPEEFPKIRYAGASLKDVFGDNSYNGEKEGSTSQVTFRAPEGMFVPGNRVFLTIDERISEDDLPEGAVLKRFKAANHATIVNQSMRTYFSSSQEPAAFDALSELVESAKHWEQPYEAHVGFGIVKSKPSFLEVIRKESSESVFSNLLAFYFEYNKRAFVKFVREILHIDDMQDEFGIVREFKYRVDLWIEDENHIIVIENKIESGVHGDQLKRYYEKAVEEAEGKGKKAWFYIFAPSYNLINTKINEHGEQYKVISYDALFDFFRDSQKAYDGAPYFEEFLNALELHTKSKAELNYEIMKKRFSQRIQNAKRDK